MLLREMYDALPDVLFAARLISNNYYRGSRKFGMASMNGVDFYDKDSFGIMNIPLKVLLKLPHKTHKGT